MAWIAQVLLTLLGVGLLLCGGSDPQICGYHGLPFFAGIAAAAGPDIITASVQQFIKISGLGTTTVYKLLNEGEIESVNVGRRRLIVIDSYRRYLERNRGVPATSPIANPPPRPDRRRADRSTGRQAPDHAT